MQFAEVSGCTALFTEAAEALPEKVARKSAKTAIAATVLPQKRLAINIHERNLECSTDLLRVLFWRAK